MSTTISGTVSLNGSDGNNHDSFKIDWRLRGNYTGVTASTATFQTFGAASRSYSYVPRFATPDPFGVLEYTVTVYKDNIAIGSKDGRDTTIRIGQTNTVNIDITIPSQRTALTCSAIVSQMGSVFTNPAFQLTNRCNSTSITSCSNTAVVSCSESDGSLQTICCNIDAIAQEVKSKFGLNSTTIETIKSEIQQAIASKTPAALESLLNRYKGTATSSNTCETVPPTEPFKCSNTACSTRTDGFTEDRTNDGDNYKCGSAGTYCCMNRSLYRTPDADGPLSPQDGGTDDTATVTPDPDSNTPIPRQGPPAGNPCALDRGGVKEYVDAFCDKKPFDAVKAKDRAFCSAIYYDKYICNNPDSSGSYEEYYPVPVPAGGKSPCAEAPWCPVEVSPPGPDASCKAYQGQTCRPGDFSDSNYCCQPNKNLECVDPAKSGISTCQYKGGVAFTPTPGVPSVEDCATQIANNRGSAGCECPSGGGCGTLSCMPEAERGNITTGPFYCTSNGTYWCKKSETSVSNRLQCGVQTPYQTPTPTPQDKSYQADCPSNPPGQYVCAAAGSCPQGYAPNAGGKGNQICSEFSSGQTPLCCIRQATGATTPTPFATTPPTPTPTRVLRQMEPPTVPNCNGNHQTWMRGTYCSTSTTCYDIYKNSSGSECYREFSGATCSFCAQ